MKRFALVVLAAALVTLSAAVGVRAQVGCKAEVELCTIGRQGRKPRGFFSARVLVISEGCAFDFVNYNPSANYSFTFPFVWSIETAKNYRLYGCQKIPAGEDQ